MICQSSSTKLSALLTILDNITLALIGRGLSSVKSYALIKNHGNAIVNRPLTSKSLTIPSDLNLTES